MVTHSTTKICPVCSSSMKPMFKEYTYFICTSCRYMESQGTAGVGAEVVALDAVRAKNFKHICKIINDQYPHCKTILDVGCSRGAFLKVARNEGFTITGLEPDNNLAQEAEKQGFDIIRGLFPDTELLSGKSYDVIIFNDSFEHIPNLQSVLKGIKEHLQANGVLIINIPTSSGFMYKTAYFLNKLGMHSPFERLWQKGFASPHIHYFNLRNLKLLLEKNGFDMKYTSSLSYYTIRGLWKRISCKSPFFITLITWTALILLYPFFAIKSDNFVVCFTLNEKSITLKKE